MEIASIRLVIIAALVPLAPLLFGYFPATGDMRDVFIPLESFFHEQQLQGSIPSWNPAVSFGFPVIAAAQIGFFYPVLFVLRFLPIWLELPSVLMLHLGLCAVGMFLFARRFKLSKEASILTALSFSLSQFLWQHLTHLNIFLAVAWFPWQMWAIDILFRKQKLTYKGLASLTALIGIPFLIGQIQIPFLMMTVALIYGMYLRLSHLLTSSPSLLLRKEKGGASSSPLLTKERLGEVSRGVLAPIIIISIATFLLASVQLLPTMELTSLSSRGTPGGFDIVRANQHSYPIYHLPTFLFPKFFGSDNTYWGKRLEIEYGTYIGVLPLLLAIWYLWGRKRAPFSPIGEKVQPAFVRDADEGNLRGITSPHPNPLPNWGEGIPAPSFFMYLLPISFLLALGSLSPFRLLGLEPSLWIFSAPARWLLFTTFCLSLFAGFGFDALWEHKDKAKKFFKRSSVLFISLIAFGNILLVLPALTPAFWQTLSPIGERGTAKITSIIKSAQTSSISLPSPYTYIALLTIIIFPYAISHKHGKKIILIVTIIDLVLIAGTTTPLVAWSNILAVPETIKDLPNNVLHHQARIYSLRDGGDTGAYFTDPESRADTAKREQQKNLVVPMVSAQFGIYGIEWPASLDITEQGNALELLHPTIPYAIENAALAQELTIGAVLSPTTDGQVEITPLESKPRFELIGENGEVKIISEHPSELIFQTKSDKNTTLIIRDTFYPGWHAYIDDTEVVITKSPLFFRSVAVPAGEHLIKMKHKPKMLYIGGILSLLTIVFLIICIKK